MFYLLNYKIFSSSVPNRRSRNDLVVYILYDGTSIIFFLDQTTYNCDSFVPPPNTLTSLPSPHMIVKSSRLNLIHAFESLFDHFQTVKKYDLFYFLFFRQCSTRLVESFTMQWMKKSISRMPSLWCRLIGVILNARNKFRHR